MDFLDQIITCPVCRGAGNLGGQTRIVENASGQVDAIEGVPTQCTTCGGATTIKRRDSPYERDRRAPVK